MTTNINEYLEEKEAAHKERVSHYDKTEKRYLKIVEGITTLYNTAESLMDHPDDILKKAEIYGMILEKVGDLHYISIQAWKYADALKKESKALSMIQERPKGRTVEVHREMAVLESQEWRMKLAEWEGLTKRWENAKGSIEEQIKIMKWKVKWELANREQHGMNNGQ
ncbi:hypothetical protein BpsM61_00030 [Bacillus phage vB_BpsM-61]|nr:hypothetical protein BpsM61_00030 [Bacillus phage vB_BpsM-61]